jgi:signal peptidase
MHASKLGLRLIGLTLVALACLGGYFWHSGYRVYVIHTGSMQPTLVPGTAVIDRPASGGYRPGDVITFLHGQGEDLVTHRITEITVSGLIHTKGDANRTADEAMSVPRLGYLLVFLKQPSGIAALVTGILGAMLLWGLFFPAASAAVERLPKHRVSEHRQRQPTQPDRLSVPVRRIAEPALEPFINADTAVMNRNDLDALRELLGERRINAG